MAGKNGGLVGERVKFFDDGVEELLMISAGEVGASDALMKKGVAREEDVFFGEVEGQ